MRFKTNLKTKTTHKPWFDQNCHQARKEYLKFKNKMHKIKTPEAHAALKSRERTFKLLIKRTKREFQKRLHNNLRNHKKSNPKMFWDILNNNKFTNNDDLISLNKFQEYFDNLGGVTSQLHTTNNNGDINSILLEGFNENNDVINEPFTVVEIKKIKSNYLKITRLVGMTEFLTKM